MNFDDLIRDDLLEFEIKTKIEVIDVYQTVNQFLNNEAERIRSFFEGRLDYIVAQEFKALEQVKNLVLNALEKIQSNRQIFNKYKDWLVLEDLEDSLVVLETLTNYSIWSRSNRNISIYAGKVEFDYLLKQEQTLEQIEVESGSIDSDVTWYETAIRNMLREEDYTSEGGVPLKIIFKNAPTAFLESVISAIDSGLKSFGLDIKRKLKFSGDDLVVLSNKETLIQSAEILLNLKKGDNPQFESLGLDQVSILGNNRASFLFPVVFRQIIEVFSTDDTFSSVEVGKISFSGDALFIDVTVSSRYSESIEGLIQL
jgi:hypothetical protein